VSSGRPFLTARWRHVAMLNYEVECSALAGRAPRGTELDTWQGRTFLSVVGFLFLDTRLWGVPIPLHRDFEEVNLRFYVRRKADDGWRRGVVFVKELVPRAAVALVARALYNENYASVPMGHALRRTADGSHVESAEYRWRVAGRANRLAVKVASPPAPLVPGSQAEFIAEHYWGYSTLRDGGTGEYRVEHPSWRVAPAVTAELDCDLERVYGPPFAALLCGRPSSAFLADGSEVSVSGGVRLDAASPAVEQS
jgi:uncharacterized protein